ncbi:hypothetical protein [Bradyrhizobium sp.]|uniref:hypothetical protein n=1 Tax=Bradyrhizobium sp. TaxID=376 RepID=UPI002731E0F2|nr:hypothetical protein [Bradyrhizobium sp.]MDP1868258.1 hypothetical protein [Bradyrhizobium sp.]MDP3076647.1 hypothetical protein [Bradyrhizobium sp.]
MTRLNFLYPNEFDSRGYRSTRDSSLEMLPQTLQAQSLRQQRPAYASRPGASPVDDRSTLPGGLLGRWLELQAAQQQPQWSEGDGGGMPSAPAEPKFRLVRISPVVQPQDGGDVFSHPSHSAVEAALPPDALRESNQSFQKPGADNERPAPVVAGIARIGRAIPIGPGTIPQIPMPSIPEWLKAIGRILQLDSTTWSGRGGGGNNDYDRCMKAAEQGTLQWDNFCRSMPPGQPRAICFTKSRESEAVKKGWCASEFGPD